MSKAERQAIMVHGNGKTLGGDLLGAAGNAVAGMIWSLSKGGTFTARGNAYGFEAIYLPPSNEEVPMPSITEKEDIVPEGSSK